jgi:uncharacterized protein
MAAAVEPRPLGRRGWSAAYTCAVLITWDPGKADANRNKHRVSFQEAATVFTDPLSTTFPSDDHSEIEPRFVTIGVSANKQILVVAHTEDDNTIRIINAPKSDQTGKTIL